MTNFDNGKIPPLQSRGRGSIYMHMPILQSLNYMLLYYIILFALQDLNMSDWDVGLCLRGQSEDQDSVSQTKDNQLIKSAIDDLF